LVFILPVVTTPMADQTAEQEHLLSAVISQEALISGSAFDQLPVTALCRRVMPLDANETLARAVELLRTCTLSVLPVVSGARLVGLLSEADLADAILQRPFGGDAARVTRIGECLPGRTMLAVLQTQCTVAEARDLFREHSSISVAPVVDAAGNYLGLLNRSDLLAVDCRTLAPGRVGGMATPLGVYLTDGYVTGGAGNFGLMLTGFVITLLGAVAAVLTGVGAAHIPAVGARLLAQATGFLVHVIGSTTVDGFASGLDILIPGLIVMVLLRSLPIAGYHAAEHQVVHCIERGYPLSADIVRRMPRVHPRCGTNLVAGLFVARLSIAVFAAELNSVTDAVVPAVIVTALCWRPVGSFLQYYFTTRPASDKQISSGIKAGEEVMARAYAQLERPPLKLVNRIMKMGIVPIFAGSFIVIGIIWILTWLFPSTNNLLGGLAF
jgi:CBS domain-containing protein